MKHTTKRALLLLAGNDWKRVEPAVLACSGEYGDSEVLVGVEAIQYGSSHVPDCPACAVLWDAALEESARRKQKTLDQAEWVRKDENNNEAFWDTLKHEHGGVPYKRSSR